jgi:DNA-binding transcriptional ArsR family regulator
MDLASPISAVSPSLEGEVLQVLARTSAGMTGRQIALLTGRRSHSGVLDALNRLTEQGLVRRVEVGRAFLFSLNREHLAADAVLALAGLRRELLKRIRGEISSWALAPVHASLFGSMARGEGDSRSDVDLFVVRPTDVLDDDPTWSSQIDGLAARIESWTGNRASIAEVTESQIGEWRETPPAIVHNLRRDALRLGGIELDDVLTGTA